MQPSRRPSIALCLAAVSLAGLMPGAAGAMRDEPKPRGEAKPNILLLITDDQRNAGTMAAMRATRRIFAAGGVRYGHAYVTTPMCCPSRASIFSGMYAHNHGLYDNDDAGRFDGSRSWVRFLDGAGYRIGVLGKYIGAAPLRSPYFDVSQRVIDWARESPDDELTFARAARRFLAESEEIDSRPWALVVATKSPHSPWVTRAHGRRPPRRVRPSAAQTERQLGDKHPTVARAARWYARQHTPNEVRRGQLRELQAADQMVGRVWQRVRRLDEERRTLAIFTSDNGYLWGEHGLYGKWWPYRESLHVPLYLRWPDHLPRGHRDGRLVGNIDLAPTILDAADVLGEVDYPLDGLSLLRGERHRWLLVESPTPDEIHRPGWTAYLDRRREYVAWADGLVEDYDLDADARQLRASDSADPAVAAALSTARACSGTSCP